MVRLDSISIAGFKSIGSRQSISFGDVSVLLGANGAGKSNVISILKMLNELSLKALQIFIASNGRANGVLHFGSAFTKEILLEANVSDDDWHSAYNASLQFGMPESLFFSKEQIRAVGKNSSRTIEAELESAGSLESKLCDASIGKDEDCAQICEMFLNLFWGVSVFQFHDTSESSRIRNSCYIEDARALNSDGGNLAAFLYAMQANSPRYYDRIVEHIRQMVPQFWDFRLEPSRTNSRSIFLNWVGERGNDYLLGPHQLSDGSLRYMALTTLLLQPKETLPNVIVLDEPELGLHPAAIASLAEMIAIASQNCQVILATQSPELANQFSADEIVIVEYDKTSNESCFKRLDSKALKDWLKDYSIAELWEKNVLGGRP